MNDDSPFFYLTLCCNLHWNFMQCAKTLYIYMYFLKVNSIVFEIWSDTALSLLTNVLDPVRSSLGQKSLLCFIWALIKPLYKKLFYFIAVRDFQVLHHKLPSVIDRRLKVSTSLGATIRKHLFNVNWKQSTAFSIHVVN